MATPLGLKNDEFKKLLNLLISSHRIIISVQLLNLSHKYLGDLSDMLLGGQVDIDADGDSSTRALSIELLDPKRLIALDGEAVEDGSAYYDKMIKVIYTVASIDGKTKFHIPLFCGPLNKVERNGAVLSCSAMGKEKLSSSTLWKAKTYKAHAGKVSVIRSLLIDIGGERKDKVMVPQTKSLLPKKLTVDGDKTAWSVAKGIAQSMGWYLFYDARGNVRVKNKGGHVQYVFRQNQSMLSQPTVSFDAEAVVNCVEVIGAKPDKAKQHIKVRVVAPRKHVLSPWKLGRFGNPRYLPLVVQDDSIRSKKEARKVGRQVLKNKLIEQVEVSFDSLPIPFLEENDICKMVSDQYTGKFRLTKMSIPLTADSAASIGYNKRVTPNPRQIRLKNVKKRNQNRRVA